MKLVFALFLASLASTLSLSAKTREIPAYAKAIETDFSLSSLVLSPQDSQTDSLIIICDTSGSMRTAEGSIAHLIPLFQNIVSKYQSLQEITVCDAEGKNLFVYRNGNGFDTARKQRIQAALSGLASCPIESISRPTIGLYKKAREIYHSDKEQSYAIYLIADEMSVESGESDEAIAALEEAQGKHSIDFVAIHLETVKLAANRFADAYEDCIRLLASATDSTNGTFLKIPEKSIRRYRSGLSSAPKPVAARAPSQ